MATLANFLKTGSLGPVLLGLSPIDVIQEIGDPEQESRKKNPLTLKYGSLQLVFWKHGPKLQLRDITLSFLPAFEPLPALLSFEDFKTDSNPTERDFRNFLKQIRYLPAHLTEEENGRQLVFLSGVVADFMDGFLHSIRISQKNTKETTQGALSDVREPSREQILEMIQESEHALQFDARRSALVMAWAALEASLRRAALKQGRQGQIGVQSTILIRELLSAGVLSPEEGRFLEQLRQLRSASVHGLAPVEIPTDVVPQVNAISQGMLARTGDPKKLKDVADIFPIDEGQAYSVLLSEKLHLSLWDFLKSKGLQGRIEVNAGAGDESQRDIQIQKTIPFKEFNRLINEWKAGYVNG
jgi:hypothetical protein